MTTNNNIRLTLNGNYKIDFYTNHLTILRWSQEIPDPDFENRPYYLNSNNELIAFERTSVTMDIDQKGLYGGAEIFFTTFTLDSKTRLDAKNLPKIIIKLDSGADPYEVVSIVKGEIHKNVRRFLQRDQNLSGGARDISEI